MNFIYDEEISKKILLSFSYNPGYIVEIENENMKQILQVEPDEKNYCTVTIPKGKWNCRLKYENKIMNAVIVSDFVTAILICLVLVHNFSYRKCGNMHHNIR